MTNWIRLLAKECLLTLNDLQEALKMAGNLPHYSVSVSVLVDDSIACLDSAMCTLLVKPGTLSQNLNVGKCYYNKMSMKAKTTFEAWAQAVGSGQAACLKLFILLNLLMCTDSKQHGQTFHPEAFETPTRRPSAATAKKT